MPAWGGGAAEAYEAITAPALATFWMACASYRLFHEFVRKYVGVPPHLPLLASDLPRHRGAASCGDVSGGGGAGCGHFSLRRAGRGAERSGARIGGGGRREKS